MSNSIHRIVYYEILTRKKKKKKGKKLEKKLYENLKKKNKQTNKTKNKNMRRILDQGMNFCKTAAKLLIRLRSTSQCIPRNHGKRE